MTAGLPHRAGGDILFVRLVGRRLLARLEYEVAIAGGGCLFTRHALGQLLG